MKDGDGTWVLKKRKYFIFTWDSGKYKKIIAHSENYLPELEIQAGLSKFSGICKVVGSILIYSTFKSSSDSICTREDPRTGKTMDLPQRLKIRLLVSQYHTNYTGL